MFKVEFKLQDGKLRSFSHKGRVVPRTGDELLYIALKETQATLLEAIESFILSPFNSDIARFQYIANAAGIMFKNIAFPVNGDLQFSRVVHQALGRNLSAPEVHEQVKKLVDVKTDDT